MLDFSRLDSSTMHKVIALTFCFQISTMMTGVIKEKDKALTTVAPNENPLVTMPVQNTTNTKRSFVKLNMKQGLLMNQILDIYALDDSENALCRNHSLEFKLGLRAFEPWALKMFDSSSKLQAGILSGNLMEFGSFKQCVNIYADSVYGPIQGQQCTLTITPTDNVVQTILGYRNISRKRFRKVYHVIEGASLYWSVCIPDSCPRQDVLSHFQKRIKAIGEGLDLNVTLTSFDCFSQKNLPKITYREYISIFILALILIVVGFTTIVDFKNRGNKKNTGVLINTFSAYTNAKYVLSFSDKAELAFLDGIRFLSISYVVLGHRFLMTLFVPSVNVLELMEWLLEYPSTIILGGTVSVDTFFMLSGLLVTYHTMETLTATKGKFSWFLFIIHRYIRVTVPLSVTVFVHATLVQYFGSGPLWSRTVAAVQKPCQYFWWSTVLHIQNYINPQHLCIAPTWYLTCDMQFYLFSPLIIYPLWRWRLLGWINFGVFYIFSVAINFYLAWINEYEASLMLSNHLLQSEFFIKHYITPYTRASTFILGVACGCILYRTKNKVIKMSPLVVAAGWCCAMVLLATVILGNHVFQLENHDYNRLEASIFLSMSRSAWVMGVIWIVWACKHGYGGPVNYFLSHPVFQIMGKISYSIFLWHMSFQFFNNGALKLPIYFANFTVLQKFLSDIFVVSVFSLVFTICVESPSAKLARLFFKKKN